MDLLAFKAAFRRSWAIALVFLVAALAGSYVYIQKQIPPTAKASVAVRDPLTVDPSAYHAAQVSFDSIVKSDRLAEMVDKAMHDHGSSAKGALSVEVVIPSNGINISPLYIVRAKDHDPHRALRMVNTAITQGRKLYALLNKIDPSELNALQPQLAAAETALANATKDYDAFAASHGGDVAAQIAAARTEVASITDRYSQAQSDFAAAQKINDAAAQRVASARVYSYASQLTSANDHLQSLQKDSSTYTNLTTNLSDARTSVQQLTGLRQSLLMNQALPVDDQIKLLDNATIESKTIMKILVWALGVIVGLLAAMGVVYAQAARQRNRETMETVIAALGAPALARIPARAVMEVS